MCFSQSTPKKPIVSVLSIDTTTPVVVLLLLGVSLSPTFGSSDRHLVASTFLVSLIILFLLDILSGIFVVLRMLVVDNLLVEPGASKSSTGKV